jgi:hypothetical protein
VASFLGSNSDCELPLGMAENPLHPPPTLSNPHECTFIRIHPPQHDGGQQGSAWRALSADAAESNQLLLATILAITTTTTNSDEKIPMPTA